MKFLTDIHTHSFYSHDSKEPLATMLAQAQKLGVAFYGVSEHFDYDLDTTKGGCEQAMIDEDAYFHGARHLQEDYEGAMNVFIGVEFGFSDDIKVQERYIHTIKKHRPDFIVNAIHCIDGVDYYYNKPYYDKQGNLREKREVYEDYLALVERSLQAPYPYDIVAHLGYVSRYAPYEDKSMRYDDYKEKLDKIFLTIIQKGKILEINGKTDGCVPARDWLQGYYDLGGRKISFGSDAHRKEDIMKNREFAVAELKEIGFTHITVPCKGEYIQVEI